MAHSFSPDRNMRAPSLVRITPAGVSKLCLDMYTRTQPFMYDIITYFLWISDIIYAHIYIIIIIINKGSVHVIIIWSTLDNYTLNIFGDKTARNYNM